jgi:hypothetical protein
MKRGGASLMMSPPFDDMGKTSLMITRWVGFASNPRSHSLRHTYTIVIVSSEVST